MTVSPLPFSKRTSAAVCSGPTVACPQAQAGSRPFALPVSRSARWSAHPPRLEFQPRLPFSFDGPELLEPFFIAVTAQQNAAEAAHEGYLGHPLVNGFLPWQPVGLCAVQQIPLERMALPVFRWR
jgi:hypothetical protein